LNKLKERIRRTQNKRCYYRDNKTRRIRRIEAPSQTGDRLVEPHNK